MHRRTSKQVESDRAKAEAKATAADAAAKAHQESLKERVAALEDAKQAEEYSLSLAELRPDRHLTASMESELGPVAVKSPREPLIELPRLLEHTISLYRSSSHRDEFLTGWLKGNSVVVGKSAAVEEETNEGQDQDYVMHSQSESEASEASCDPSLSQKPRLKASGTFKPQRNVANVRFFFTYLIFFLTKLF